MKKLLLTLLAVLITFPTLAAREKPATGSGTITDFFGWSESQQNLFAVGVVYGSIQTAILLSEDLGRAVYGCPVSPRQVVELLTQDKEVLLSVYPDEQMSVLIMVRYYAACGLDVRHFIPAAGPGIIAREL